MSVRGGFIFVFNGLEVLRKLEEGDGSDNTAAPQEVRKDTEDASGAAHRPPRSLTFS